MKKREMPCVVCGVRVYHLPEGWWAEGGVAVCPTCCAAGGLGGIVANAMLRDSDGPWNTSSAGFPVDEGHWGPRP